LRHATIAADDSGVIAGARYRHREEVDWHAVMLAFEHGVVMLDPDARIVAANPAAERLLDRSLSDLEGLRADELGLGLFGVDGTPLEASALPSQAALRSGTAQPDVLVGVRAKEGVRWLSVTATPLGSRDCVTGAVVALVDVSAHRERELEWQQLSQRDDLTGLPNRRRFVELLDLHLASLRREDAHGALLLLDLDRFKELNDTFGHAAGDRVLVQVARAIGERLREDDVLARLGGDEFAVLLKRATATDAGAVAEALVQRLAREPMPAAHGGTRPVSASVGAVVLAGAATGTAERALARADAAMYEAKAAGRGGWRIGRAAGRASDGALDEQLAKRSRQLALANAVGARLAGMTEAAEIAEITADELRRAFGYHLCAVIRVREDDRVEALAVRGTGFDALRLRGWSQPRDRGLIGRCLRERTPVMVNDVSAEDDYNVTSETGDVCAELVVPLVVDDRLWGAINIEELQPDAFDHDDVILLSTLANQVAAALRAAALVQRVTEAERALRACRHGDG
jgi:diguanylate cyclase (GGDEF)-like protein